MNSNDEFLKAFSDIAPISAPAVEYRLHYDDTGAITQCTMLNHPDDTQYLVVNALTYDNYFKYYVKDNKLKLIDPAPEHRVQLKSSDAGYHVVKNHASVILESDEYYPETEYYERRNS